MPFQPDRVYEVHCILCNRYLGDYMNVTTGTIRFYCPGNRHAHTPGYTKVFREDGNLIEQFEPKEPNAAQVAEQEKPILRVI